MPLWEHQISHCFCCFHDELIVHFQASYSLSEHGIAFLNTGDCHWKSASARNLEHFYEMKYVELHWKN
jgi:hypothetical protein